MLFLFIGNLLPFLFYCALKGLLLISNQRYNYIFNVPNKIAVKKNKTEKYYETLQTTQLSKSISLPLLIQRVSLIPKDIILSIYNSWIVYNNSVSSLELDNNSPIDKVILKKIPFSKPTIWYLYCYLFSLLFLLKFVKENSKSIRDFFFSGVFCLIFYW